MSKKSAGYSGTPLAKKLGIAEGTRVAVRGAPKNYVRFFDPVPSGVVFENKVSSLTDIVHVFADRRAALKKQLETLRKIIKPDGVVWVSWPKKASGIATDITEDTIREVALPLGFVDIKVCAVSEVWSGLKLMIRKELRK
jgi:hypothetical protein